MFWSNIIAGFFLLVFSVLFLIITHSVGTKRENVILVFALIGVITMLFGFFPSLMMGLPKAKSPQDCQNILNKLIKDKSIKFAERMLLESYERLSEKTLIANIIGQFYFQHKGNLSEAVKWFTKAVELDQNGEYWPPYTYLAGIYGGFAEYKEQTSALNESASTIRGAAVSVDLEWKNRLHDLLGNGNKTCFISLLQQLWDSCLKDKIKIVAKKQEPVPGLIFRPDLACVQCGNANIKLGYRGTHWICDCGTIICNACYTRISYTCPKCGAHEKTNYVE